MGQPFTYHEVQTDSDIEDSFRMKRRSNRSSDRRCWAALFVFLLGITTLNAIAVWKLWDLSKTTASHTHMASHTHSPSTLHSSVPSSTEPEPITNCGKSRTEAISRGCVLDIMAGAWLPKICYDEELALDVLSNSTDLAKIGGAGPLPWWEDHNHTIPIAADSLKDLDSLVANTWEPYHSAHCLYNWRILTKATKRVRWGEKGVYIHTQAINFNHVNHCNEALITQPPGLGRKTQVEFGLGTCVRLDKD
ncbi:hypothetical protein H112_00659 [Trichophyton rubrum D6]|uniref:Uncharacterized protein n=4 Tax=Trichophyton TaxID=5550 RepID=A0A178F516_TRIRU|nr:uncharacterized protein TERG_07780 [Trichophyton rubrum CBS 118892]EZF27370.1 hypothetical protein H100_00659 [Trichophyton rubrum MR850]EZF46412.1 hypothetical protein H102_00656 [Trichophyton rubrum CBS 100081]EZF57034.1 hypothetical protein H103_00658 [Trichophyton rubrum CBS 288.86]EZF67667.1 hypothetical protein H104_00645 [Trichophyton rubrum CBS 289.86]EZF78260.1 hypothetical protein H105_00654 [Trichophyton soudanense CBS 452.61]EZF88967.1 hypothetical protein H110_00663 [Trichophy